MDSGVSRRATTCQCACGSSCSCRTGQHQPKVVVSFRGGIVDCASKIHFGVIALATLGCWRLRLLAAPHVPGFLVDACMYRFAPSKLATQAKCSAVTFTEEGDYHSALFRNVISRCIFVMSLGLNPMRSSIMLSQYLSKNISQDLWLLYLP